MSFYYYWRPIGKLRTLFWIGAQLVLNNNGAHKILIYFVMST